MAGLLHDKKNDTSIFLGEGLLGHIHAITGSQAIIGLLNSALNGPHREVITVGKFVKIRTTKAILVGVITDVSTHGEPDEGNGDTCRGIAHIYLMGEIAGYADPVAHFRRGINNYPTIGDIVEPLTNSELQLIFQGAGSTRINIGVLQQDTLTTSASSSSQTTPSRCRTTRSWPRACA